MYQLVAVGDITVDLYFKGASLTQEKDRFSLAVGGKYYADAFHSGIGGSAANVAIHASQLGLNSSVVATVGENSFKNMIVQTLAKKSVSTEFIHFEREHMSISTILLTQGGERTIVKYSDPKDHIYLPEHALDRIQKSSIIFLGNVSDVPMAEREAFLKNVKTSENLVAVNFSVQDCENGVKTLIKLLDHTDILFVNKFEFADLIGKKLETLDLTKNHFSAVHTGLKALVVTDGPEGSYAYTAKELLYEKAVKVAKIIDTTGAGDSYTAAFLSSYHEHKNLQQALAAASQYAAKKIEVIGAN